MDDQDTRRFVLVAVHRGPVARALQAEYKKHGQERFHMHCAQLAPLIWTHISRLSSGTHYRIAIKPGPMTVMELREVQRLFWPEGSQSVEGDWRERRRRRNAHRNPIMEEWRERKRRK